MTAMMRLNNSRSGGGWQTHNPNHSARAGTVGVAAGFDIYHLVYRPIQTCSLLVMV